LKLQQKHPTLDLTLFKIRLFAAGSLTGFMNSLSFQLRAVSPVIISPIDSGYSAAKTGILLIPMEIHYLLISPISGRLADRYGGQVLSSIGLLLNASALIWFSTLNQKSSYSAVLISLVLFGLGSANVRILPISVLLMGSVPAEKRGVANGIRMTFNNHRRRS